MSKKSVNEGYQPNKHSGGKLEQRMTVINPRRYRFPQLQLEGVVLFRLRHLKNRSK